MKHMGSPDPALESHQFASKAMRRHVPDRKFHVPDRKKGGVAVCLTVKTALSYVLDRK